eukprot:COSAG03_NODE_10123_length_670_cov_2.784588_1_plen_30_part_10
MAQQWSAPLGAADAAVLAPSAPPAHLVASL